MTRTTSLRTTSGFESCLGRDGTSAVSSPPRVGPQTVSVVGRDEDCDIGIRQTCWEITQQRRRHFMKYPNNHNALSLTFVGRVPDQILCA